MTRSLISYLVALLTLVACGAPTSEAPAAGLLLVPEDDELRALLVDADAQWEAAGVAADRIAASEPGAEAQGVPVVWRSTEYVSAKCMPNGGKAIGCLDVHGEGLIVAFDAPREKLALIVRHELGHTLRDVREEWHVSESVCATDRAAATMCEGSVATTITEADSEFICDSETEPCQ
jgi:hypothetical protein